MFLLPAAGSRREQVYSTRSGEQWSSRRRALGWCPCANTSASASSGTRPRSSSLQTHQHQALLGRERRPTAPQGRAGHLRRNMTGSYIISSGGEGNFFFSPLDHFLKLTSVFAWRAGEVNRNWTEGWRHNEDYHFMWIFTFWVDRKYVRRMCSQQWAHWHFRM